MSSLLSIADFSSSVLFHKSPVITVYFIVGWVFGASTVALLVTSLAGLLRPRYRRRMAAAASVLSWIVLSSALFGLTAYLWEIWSTVSSSNSYEKFTFFRARFDGIGYYKWIYWTQVICLALVPQLFWLRRCRTHLGIAFVIALIAFCALNYEAFVIYYTAQSEEFLPSSWNQYH